MQPLSYNFFTWKNRYNTKLTYHKVNIFLCEKQYVSVLPISPAGNTFWGKLDLKNKKSYIFALNHFNPSFLESFRNIDCFVSTACPRIAIDDYMQYKTPIITPIELDILLGLKKWGDYKFDEILIN